MILKNREKKGKKRKVRAVVTHGKKRGKVRERIPLLAP